MAKIKVKNRSWGTTLYVIPEFENKVNLTRIFGPGEVKEIEESEIEALTFVPGGLSLLTNHLQIMDPVLADKYIYNKEPEYDMSEEDVKNLMLTGSYDEFLDCLDFAPAGIIDLIKNYAITLPLNDSAKREALRTKYNYDVDKILLNMRDDEEEEPVVEQQRRVQPKQNGSQRRVTPEYKVVEKKED